MDSVTDFFALARERYSILLKREAGEPKPWTENKLFQRYHVCNVFRDDDAVSRYIMGKLRSGLPPRTTFHHVAAICRLINDEHSLAQLDVFDPIDWPRAIRTLDIKVNTHAYKINTPLGLNSKEGIGVMIRRILNFHAFYQVGSLQTAFNQLVLAGLPPFIAYQAAHDLKGTGIPTRPMDENTWTFIGPGAIRGALRISGHDIGKWAESKGYVVPKDGMRTGSVKESWLRTAVKELAGVKDPLQWTTTVAHDMMSFANSSGLLWSAGWPSWHLSEAENWLCEFDKICRWQELGPRGRRFKGEA